MAELNEVKEALIREHEVIRAEIHLRLQSLKAETSGDLSSAERIRNYTFGLHDLREGLKRHIAIDERVFKTFVLKNQERELRKEHELIEREVNQAVQMCDEITDTLPTMYEMETIKLKLKESISRILTMLENHMAKEEQLFKF